MSDISSRSIDGGGVKNQPKCPRCGGQLLYRAGRTGNGKQRYRCKLCGKHFQSYRGGVKPLVAEIATGLVREGVPVPIIAKAMHKHCSRRWLYLLRADLINAAS